MTLKETKNNMTTSKLTTKRDLDLGLVMFDFSEALREDTHSALCALYELLLDETLCRTRIELLRSLEDRALRELAHLIPSAEQDDFRDVITIIARGETFPSVEEGRLHLDRLAAFTRDSDALWQAHRALSSFDDEKPASEAAAEAETALLTNVDIEIDGTSDTAIVSGATSIS